MSLNQKLKYKISAVRSLSHNPFTMASDKVNIKSPEIKITIKKTDDRGIPIVPAKWWEDYTTIYRTPNTTKCNFTGKIFGTDLVGTLIQAKNGDSMPRGLNDWVWCTEGIPGFLNQKHKEGYTIVIFSNYQKVANNNGFKESLKERIELIIKDLAFEPFFFASLSDAKADIYSKPNTGMWQILEKTGIFIDKKQSCYTGDRFDDFSEVKSISRGADINFAKNVGIVFKRPREVYPQQPKYTPSGKKELIIMVGNQGSGKSTTAKEFKGYTVISRDGKKHINPIISVLQAGKSVIFDATNPSKENRAEMIALAKKYDAVPIILWCGRDGRFDNAMRQGKEKVPTIAYTRYQTLFEEPTSDECEMHRIN